MSTPVPTVVGSITETASDGSITVPNTTPPAVGNLLVAFFGAYASGGSRNISSAPAGWVQQQARSGDEEVCALYTKVADSGDVAAGGFTFTISGTADVMAGVVIKCTNAPSGAEIAGSEADTEADGSGGTFSYTTNLTPTTAESIIIAMYQGADNTNLSSAPTVASYASTPSLTWAELSDIGGKNSSLTMCFGVAYANISGLTNITARTAAASAGVNDGKDSLAIIVNGIQDASGTAALLSQAPTIFTPAGKSGTTGTVVLLQTSPTVFAPSSDEDSPTNKWNNTSKSSQGTVRNTPKS